MGIEIISRRVQSYVDAYTVNPQKPNWGLAKYYEADSQDCNAVGTELKKYIARQTKEDFDLQLAATRVRDQRAGLAVDRVNSWGNYDDTGGDVGGGGEVAPKAKAKSKGRARQLQGGAAG